MLRRSPSAGGLTLGGLRAHGGSAQPVATGFGFPGIGFDSVPASLAPVADVVTVPAGYTAQVFVAWGDPIMPGGTPFVGDASETAAEQLHAVRRAQRRHALLSRVTGADGQT